MVSSNFSSEIFLLLPVWVRRRLARKSISAANNARDSQRWVQAAEEFHAALKQVPHRSDLWVQYGHALKETGLLVDAELAYWIGLDGQPDNADTYLQIGHVLKLQGRLTEAKVAYQKAAQLDPNVPGINQEI